MNLGQFECPDCGGGLRPGDGPETAGCGSCHRTWPVRFGTVVFSDPDFYYGELPRDRMQAALSLGPDRIDEVRDVLATAGPWLPEYAFDVSRADWRVPLGVAHGGRVLDYGCGMGAVSMALAPHYDEVRSCDPTPERAAFLNLRAAAAGMHNVTAAAADVETIPYAQGSFDVVVVMGVLEWTPLSSPHLSPREAELAQLRRLVQYLKPGGTFVLGIENRIGIRYVIGGKEEHSDLRMVSLLPRRLADVYSRAVRKEDYRNWTYSAPGTAALLEEAGLVDAHPFGVYFHYSFPDLVYPMTLGNREAGRLGRSLGAATNEHWRSSRVFPLVRRGLERSRLFRTLAPSLLVTARAPGGAHGGRVPAPAEVVVPSRHVPGLPMRTVRFTPSGARETLRSRDASGGEALRSVHAALAGLGVKPYLPAIHGCTADAEDVVVEYEFVDGESATDWLEAETGREQQLLAAVAPSLADLAFGRGEVDAVEVETEVKELGGRLGVEVASLLDRLGRYETVPAGLGHRSLDLDRLVRAGGTWVLTDWDDVAAHGLAADGLVDLASTLHRRAGAEQGLVRSPLWQDLCRLTGEHADAALPLALLRRAARSQDEGDRDAAREALEP